MRKYIVAGLLVWLPLAVTVWLLTTVLGIVDGLFGWLVSATQAVLPDEAHGFLELLRHVYGLGLVVVLSLIHI